MQLDGSTSNGSSVPRKVKNSAILAWCAAAAVLLLVLIAVSVPRDVITQYRVLQYYSDASRVLIPGIDRLAAVSSFPEVTRLVISAMWTLVPIFVVVFCWK